MDNNEEKIKQISKDYSSIKPIKHIVFIVSFIACICLALAFLIIYGFLIKK